MNHDRSQTGRKAIRRVCLMIVLVSFGLAASAGAGCKKSGASLSESIVWSIDRIDEIGGHPVTVVGEPKVVDTPEGRAVEFDGVDDALFVDVHPLAGALEFTWEVVFRPDPGGAPAQRFFHLQERDPATGADTRTRMLFETRLDGNDWCLDSYARCSETSLTLIDRAKLHPLGRFYHIALTYDGKELRHYVDHVLQGTGAVSLTPQGQGRSSIGVRINRVDYFKGAIRLARFTRRALTPAEFLPRPSADATPSVAASR